MLSNGRRDLGGAVIDLMVRVSKRNNRGGESYLTEETQEEMARAAVLALGGKPGKLLTLPEKDQSGWNAPTSPAWIEAIERREAGLNDGVAFGFDHRSGRNWWRLGAWYEQMEQVGAEIVYADSPLLDYRTPEGRQLLGMRAVMNETPVHNGRNNQEGTLSKMLEHCIPNRVPYGYRRNEVHGVKADPTRHAKWIVPDDATAPVVKLIFNLRAAGRSWPQIADRLEADGVPSPKGEKRWAYSTLSQVIEAEAYIGVMVYGKHRIPDAWKPLVKLGRWQDAQSERTRKRTGRMVAGIAGGLLVCSSCGNTLQVHHRQAPGKLSYGCRGSNKAGRCPRKVFVDKDQADAFVEAWCAERLERRGQRLSVVAATRELADARMELELARADLEQWVVAGSMGLEARLVQAGSAARTARVEKAEAAEAEALGRLGDAEGLPSSGAAWRDLSEEDRHRVARRLIERIVVPPFTGKARKLSRVADRLRDNVIPR